MPAVRIKDHWREQRLFDQRSLVSAAVIGLATVALIARLFVLQVSQHDYYSELSQGNRVRTEPIPAARGLILDRYGDLIAGSQPTYQLELVPEEVPDIDATLDSLVQLKLIRTEEVDEIERTIESSRNFDSVPIRLRMSDEDVARFAVHRFEFRGVDIKTRQTRWYPNGALGVHALGYVGAISEQDLKRIDRSAYGGRAHSCPSSTARRRWPAMICCSRSTSRFSALRRRRWPGTAARWWRSTRTTATCWRSSASRDSIQRSSVRALPPPSTRRWRRTSTNRSSTAPCAARILPARLSSPCSGLPRSPTTRSRRTPRCSATPCSTYRAAATCGAQTRTSRAAGSTCRRRSRAPPTFTSTGSPRRSESTAWQPSSSTSATARPQASTSAARRRACCRPRSGSARRSNGPRTRSGSRARRSTWASGKVTCW